MKKCIIFVLSFMLVFNNFCYAMPKLIKNETVYINLENDGKINQINVYSNCINNGADKIEDYTKYSEITNLTNSEKFISGDEKVIWNISGEKRFSYTGKVGEEYYNLLPWNFNIKYKLNGVEVKKDDLLGANGLIVIEMEINANDKAIDYYKNNYMLEVTASYDMSDYLSVNSEEALVTNTGNTKTLMFIVLPGQSTTLNIEIGSNDFQMDGITMAAVPITGEILNQISELTQNKKDIEDASNAIDTSTDVILNSLQGMNSGLNGISSGVKEIQNGTKKIHGISNLRDEDIAKLKEIFNELSPIIENFNCDLENLSDTYKIFVELSENLNEKLKELNENIDDLNKNLADIEEMMEDFPKNIGQIRSSIKTLSSLTGNLNSLIKGVESSNANTQKELVECLVQIGDETTNIGGIVKETLPEVSGDVQSSLLDIGNSANKIGANVINIKEILSKMSGSTVPNVGDMSNNLKDLKNDLNKISKMLDEEDAEILKDTVSEFVKTSNTLEEMLEIATTYNDKILTNSGDFDLAIDNMKNLSIELKQMNILCINMISNLQKTLSIISNDIYNGADKTTNSILSVNNELIRITNESDKFMNSKNTIKNIVKDKWNDVEETTNVFNIDKEAKVISFGSEKNENVNQVEFILKTPDIKKVKEKEVDLESNTNKTTFWDRLVNVLDKMFGWIIRIFK